jgi:beta-galactosidase
MSNFSKGIVWVNGNNLGRFWDIGPGRRLFCPAGYMREGSNEIIVFDLHRITPAIIIGKKTPIG